MHLNITSQNILHWSSFWTSVSSLFLIYYYYYYECSPFIVFINLPLKQQPFIRCNNYSSGLIMLLLFHDRVKILRLKICMSYDDLNSSHDKHVKDIWLGDSYLSYWWLEYSYLSLLTGTEMLCFLKTFHNCVIVLPVINDSLPHLGVK